MTNAPERIWIEDEFGDGDLVQCTYGNWYVGNYVGYDVEYVRADIVQALTADFARQVQRTDEQREAYEQALSVMEAERDGLLRCVTDNHVALCRAKKADAERDRLREALADALFACDAHNKHGDSIHGWWVHDARAALK